MLSPRALDRVLSAYGLSDVTYGSITGGYRNISHQVILGDGRQLNLIVYKQEPGMERLIRRTNALGDYLAQQGLPVRCTADRRIVRLRGSSGVRLASLYTYLGGDTIPWEAYTRHHIKLLGMALADIHTYSDRLPDSTRYPRVTDVYGEALGSLRAYFLRPGVQGAMSIKLGVRVELSLVASLAQFVAGCTALPDQQVLHLDLVRGNVLFRDARPNDRYQLAGYALSGILDLEKAAIGHRLVDVARTLAFLLVDCSTKSQTVIYKSFIDSGYRKRGRRPLRAAHLTIHGATYDVLESWIGLFLLYDFYKFLQQNPYESLADNYHYQRTRDMLVARKMLQSI